MRRLMKRTRAQSARAEQLNFKSVLGGTISNFEDKQIIHPQDKVANTLFYIREGEVMFTMQSKGRRPAVIAVLNSGDFFALRTTFLHQ